MIHVVVTKCLIGLPLLIHIALLWRSRSRKFEKSRSRSRSRSFCVPTPQPCCKHMFCINGMLSSRICTWLGSLLCTYTHKAKLVSLWKHIFFGDAQQIPASALSRWVYTGQIYYTPTWPFIPTILPSFEILLPVQSFHKYTNCYDCLALH
jgi:hypothetical protein